MLFYTLGCLSFSISVESQVRMVVVSYVVSCCTHTKKKTWDSTCPIPRVQAFALPNSQRKDNAESPRMKYI